MEATACPEPSSQPSDRSASLGTGAGSSAGSDPCNRSRSGRSAPGSSSRATSGISPSSTSRSRAKLRGCDLVRLGFGPCGRLRTARSGVDHPAACAGLGWCDRPRPIGLRDTFVAADEGRTDLPEDRQSARGAASPRAHEGGQHGSLSRRRTRGCAQHRGATRHLTQGRMAAAVRPPEPVDGKCYRRRQRRAPDRT